MQFKTASRAFSSSPLYLGFDLSTQQLKAIIVDSQLKVHNEVRFEFDVDAKGYSVEKGVLTHEELHEVYAPVAMWLQAVDVVMERLKADGLDFSRIKAISGAGQQHGSVYWSFAGEQVLQSLDSSQTLEKQLDHAFSHPFSPNWQDASTQAECDLFDKELSSEEQLALITGSKAHHRFTGPQILRFQRHNPEAYCKTSRISLVSSWLASVFLGKIAPMDISDVCGANLWDINAGNWNKQLMSLASNGDPNDLARKLGPVPEDGGADLGRISEYFVQRYGFAADCRIVPFTGDNPSTILALPLRSGDAMVSLGTSTTFLMSTHQYKPDPAVHFFNHPTTASLYMFMLCYKNGGLARENIRDAINSQHTPPPTDIWANFNTTAESTPPAGQNNSSSLMRLGLFFPRPEIVPNVRAGIWRYAYTPASGTLSEITGANPETWSIPKHDARAIVESQLLSLRLRSRDIVEKSPDHPSLPAQPRRIYLVGGGSKDPTISALAGQILGGSEGVHKLDVGQNACALGAAYKAVWAAERKEGETFEELIGKRWDEEKFSVKVGDGYDERLYGIYGEALKGFERMEKKVLNDEKKSSGKSML